MAKRFIFLEIMDSELVSLLTGIRDLAMEARSTSQVHVTVRGPYHREVPVRKLQHWQQLVAKQPLILNGVGGFAAGTTYTVFLRVQHPSMRRIWWKPDFPVNAFGFNPHITLYEGSDANRAYRLKEFLLREGLKLLTWDFRVTAFVSDHRDLFGTRVVTDEPFLGLVNRGLVRPDILARLARSLRFSNSCTPREIRSHDAMPAAPRA